MIQRNESTKHIAQAIPCDPRTVRKARARHKLFSSTKAPPNHIGRKETTARVQDDLLEEIAKKPTMYRSEMRAFLRDRFEVEVSLSSITRLLKSAGWTRKGTHRVAQQRNTELRNLYLYKISKHKSYQMIFIDESGADRRTGHRDKRWAPSGVTPIQVGRLNREQRYQILAAYTQDGIELARVYPGSTDAAMFKDFIEQLLRGCGQWPQPKSVLVMDNASFHRSEEIEQMCTNAGVELVYLPPYSPDLNPIEEFFAELKNFIKNPGPELSELSRKDFKSFLQACVDAVGRRKASARGHFRHTGVAIDEYEEQMP
ncbi:transposase [Fusarium albosuccineum]|uniref:Transposase n=1 Tax=Fusarium albosuccineum TaxID=1237068 RepID=A0A8H4P2X7_9HYPO|nr:transposase [Fusarium albosuccineum]